VTHTATVMKKCRTHLKSKLKLTAYIDHGLNRKINASGKNVVELLETALAPIKPDTTRQDTARRLTFLLRACQSPNVSKVQIERNIEAYIKELGKDV